MFIKFCAKDESRDKIVNLIKDKSLHEAFRSILDRLCAIILALNNQKKINVEVYRDLCLQVYRDILTTFKNEDQDVQHSQEDQDDQDSQVSTSWVKISPRSEIMFYLENCNISFFTRGPCHITVCHFSETSCAELSSYILLK